MGKSNYFEGERLSDKVAVKLAKVATATQGIKAPENAKAILGAAAFPTTGNFAVCSDTDLAYLTTGGVVFKANRIPLSAITSVAMVSPKFPWNYVTVSLGGAQSVTLEVQAAQPDVQAFFEFVKNKVDELKGQGAPAASGGADEIMKFKQLLDAGAITQEEFDAKKKQLLGL